MYFYKPKAVYAASERQYTAAVGEVYVVYLGLVAYLRVNRWSEVSDTRIGETNAVLRELYRSVATKRELSNTSKLSVLISIFVPILTYGHGYESWVMTARILTQPPKMGFLRKLHGETQGRTEIRCRLGQETSLASSCSNLSLSKRTALKKKTFDMVGTFRRPVSSEISDFTNNNRSESSQRSEILLDTWALCPPRYAPGVTLCDKVRSYEIGRALNVEPLVRMERPQLHSFGHVSRMPHKRLARQVLLAKPTGKRPSGCPRPRWSDCISDLAWPRLGLEPAELSEIAIDHAVFTLRFELTSCNL